MINQLYLPRLRSSIAHWIISLVLALGSMGSALLQPALVRAAAPAVLPKAPLLGVQRQAGGPPITKAVSQASAVVSNTLLYTITVNNPNSFPIAYFGPIDPLSPTLTVNDGTPGYAVVSGTLAWNPTSGSPAPLGVGASVVYTFTAHVDACGDILNAASFAYRRDGVAQLTRADSNVVGTKVPCQSHLIYSKEVNTTTTTISNTIQWTILVTNTGGITGTFYGPYDNLPANVTFQSATPGYTGPNPLFWNPTGTAIGPGATNVYTIAVHVDGPCNKPIVNKAFIESPTDGGNTNEVLTEVLCDGKPNLVVEKQVSAATAAISNTLVYTILVTNSGNGAGSYLGPFDPLPLSNVTFQSATPGYSGPNPLKWNSPTPKSIAPGATDIYTAAVHVDGPCGAIFYNRAIIEAPAPVQQSNVVSTTVVCPNGWKLAVPIWVHGGGVFTYAIELENTSDTPRRMGWSDSQLRVISNSAKAPGDADGVIVGSDTAAQYTFEIGKPPAATAIVITGPCKPPYMCDFLDGQVSQKPNDAYRASGTADGTSWAGVVPSNTRVIWPIKIYVGYTPPCGKEIKNTTVITHVSTTGEISSTFATAQARVMCPDLGDAPDSSNHAGTPMRMGPYGAPSPLAHYPSVFGGSVVGDEGPIHYLAGASSNITSGLPANAIDSALGFRQANNVSQSIVSNERDADWQPDQDLAWLKPNLLTSAVITNARSNRDGYDNAFNHPVTGLPLPQSLNTCSTGLVRYAQYVNPATSYVGNRFVNMWIDWNMDGDWADSFTSSCGAVKTPIINSEWVAQNVVANLATGIYQIPAFVVGNIPVPKRLWVRISIADSPAPISSTGNGPAAGYVYGETEDHLLCYKQPTPAIAASWVDCPAPKIIIDHALPDATVQLNRYFTHTVTISPTDSDPGLPVTVTWSVVSPLKATYDLKANKKVVLAGAQNARYPDQVFNTDPITEVVTTGESSVLVAFFGEGDYTISVNVQTADGETETESVTLTAANTRTYLPLVLK